MNDTTRREQQQRTSEKRHNMCCAVFPVQPTTVDVLEQVEAARTCFFGDHPEPRRMYQSMRNCEIGHESAEIVAWVENFRASTDHGGRRKKFRLFVRPPRQLKSSKRRGKKANRRTLEHIETPSTDLENMV